MINGAINHSKNYLGKERLPLTESIKRKRSKQSLTCAVSKIFGRYAHLAAHFGICWSCLIFVRRWNAAGFGGLAMVKSAQANDKICPGPSRLQRVKIQNVSCAENYCEVSFQIVHCIFRPYNRLQCPYGKLASVEDCVRLPRLVNFNVRHWKRVKLIYIWATAFLHSVIIQIYASYKSIETNIILMSLGKTFWILRSYSWPIWFFPKKYLSKVLTNVENGINGTMHGMESAERTKLLYITVQVYLNDLNELGSKAC